METGWRDRIKQLADADGRSFRQISKDAGCGPNYLSEMLVAKDPTIDKLLSILSELGNASLFYVLTGLPLSDKDVPFLRLVLSAPEDMRAPMQQILSRIADGQSPQAPLLSDDRPNEPKFE